MKKLTAHTEASDSDELSPKFDWAAESNELSPLPAPVVAEADTATTADRSSVSSFTAGVTLK